MPIITVRENEDNRWRRKGKKKKTERKKGVTQSVTAKWFCCAFKLDFSQLTCKDSLVFKSSLELALSMIWKERELYKSKHVVVECRCLKIWDLPYFLICSSIKVFFKMTTNFANVSRTTIQVKLYITKIQIIRNWIFILKMTFNFEWTKK